MNPVLKENSFEVREEEGHIHSGEKMHLTKPYSKEYRVSLLGVGQDTDEEKEFFCRRLSEEFNISQALLRKIVDHCPIVLKSNLTWKMAEPLMRTLKSLGAQVLVEARKNLPTLSLEFQGLTPHCLALEYSSFGRTQSGNWEVIGRARNLVLEPLGDVWVLIQLFDAHEEFLSFEEVPLILNPLPPGEVSPFKAIFERDLSLHKVSVGFKTSSGSPLGTLDKRPGPEWRKIRWEDGNEAVLSIDLSKRPHPIEVKKPPEEVRIENLAGDPGLLPCLKEEGPGGMEDEAPGGMEEPSGAAQKEIEVIQGNVSFDVAMIQEDRQLQVRLVAESERVESAGAKEPARDEMPPPPAPPSAEATALAGEEEKGLVREAFDQPAPSPVILSALKEDSRSTDAIPETTDREEKEIPLFPWIGEFGDSIETYYRGHPDPFIQWYRSRQSENAFRDDSHSLVTLLAHARFDQRDVTAKALENTDRIFQLLARPQVVLEDIPALEGTLFFSQDQWRDLFFRALPKLQQISQNVLAHGKGEALEIERMIQVIPHMSERMSRKAVRWMGELMGRTMTIDFSNRPVSVDRNLYRVASRLGVVDPHFDIYLGRNSMGDSKIQAFAKAAFPQDPSKIETPMTWIGGDRAGGHCLPSQPICGTCPFGRFCQKLCLHFDPPEKGMGRH